MSTEPARTGATTAAGGGTSIPVATAPPGGGLPPAAGTAAVTVAQRRVSDIGQGDVIALPDDVFVQRRYVTANAAPGPGAARHRGS